MLACYIGTPESELDGLWWVAFMAKPDYIFDFFEDPWWSSMLSLPIEWRMADAFALMNSYILLTYILIIHIEYLQFHQLERTFC